MRYIKCAPFIKNGNLNAVIASHKGYSAFLVPYVAILFFTDVTNF